MGVKVSLSQGVTMTVVEVWYSQGAGAPPITPSSPQPVYFKASQEPGGFVKRPRVSSLVGPLGEG